MNASFHLIRYILFLLIVSSPVQPLSVQELAKTYKPLRPEFRHLSPLIGALWWKSPLLKNYYTFGDTNLKTNFKLSDINQIYKQHLTARAEYKQAAEEERLDPDAEEPKLNTLELYKKLFEKTGMQQLITQELFHAVGQSISISKTGQNSARCLNAYLIGLLLGTTEDFFTNYALKTNSSPSESDQEAPPTLPSQDMLKKELSDKLKTLFLENEIFKTNHQRESQLSNNRLNVTLETTINNLISRYTKTLEEFDCFSNLLDTEITRNKLKIPYALFLTFVFYSCQNRVELATYFQGLEEALKKTIFTAGESYSSQAWQELFIQAPEGVSEEKQIITPSLIIRDFEATALKVLCQKNTIKCLDNYTINVKSAHASDCMESLLRMLLNIILFQKSSDCFAPPQEKFPNSTEELITFYDQNRSNNFADLKETHQAWGTLVNNAMPWITYNRVILPNKKIIKTGDLEIQDLQGFIVATNNKTIIKNKDELKTFIHEKQLPERTLGKFLVLEKEEGKEPLRIKTVRIGNKKYGVINPAECFPYEINPTLRNIIIFFSTILGLELKETLETSFFEKNFVNQHFAHVMQALGIEITEQENEETSESDSSDSESDSESSDSSEELSKLDAQDNTEKELSFNGLANNCNFTLTLNKNHGEITLNHSDTDQTKIAYSKYDSDSDSETRLEQTIEHYILKTLLDQLSRYDELPKTEKTKNTQFFYYLQNLETNSDKIHFLAPIFSRRYEMTEPGLIIKCILDLHETEDYRSQENALDIVNKRIKETPQENKTTREILISLYSYVMELMLPNLSKIKQKYEYLLSPLTEPIRKKELLHELIEDSKITFPSRIIKYLSNNNHLIEPFIQKFIENLSAPIKNPALDSLSSAFLIKNSNLQKIIDQAHFINLFAQPTENAILFDELFKKIPDWWNFEISPQIITICLQQFERTIAFLKFLINKRDCSPARKFIMALMPNLTLKQTEKLTSSITYEEEEKLQSQFKYYKENFFHDRLQKILIKKAQSEFLKLDEEELKHYTPEILRHLKAQEIVAWLSSILNSSHTQAHKEILKINLPNYKEHCNNSLIKLLLTQEITTPSFINELIHKGILLLTNKHRDPRATGRELLNLLESKNLLSCNKETVIQTYTRYKKDLEKKYIKIFENFIANPESKIEFKL